tara:strand:+ start:21995 stop:22921 length:927 start_codon:yes stop_codon:yes gene_type:complete
MTDKDDVNWEPEESELKEDLDSEELEQFVDIVDDSDDDDKSGGVADDEPEEEDDGEGRQRRFQKRIDELTAGRHQAERREAAATEELLNLRSRLDKVESGADESRVGEFQERVQQVRDGLKKASEEGDTDTQVELTERLADMKAASRIHEMQQRYKEYRKKGAENAAREGAANAGQEVRVPQLAKKWLSRNKWFNGEGTEAETAFARSIDNQVDADGFDQETPEYYEELDKRLQKVFPKLYSPAKGRNRSKPATIQSGGSRGKGKRSGDGRIRFTKEQFQTARDLGLTTKEDLLAYAKEIKILEAENG